MARYLAEPEHPHRGFKHFPIANHYLSIIDEQEEMIEDGCDPRTVDEIEWPLHDLIASIARGGNLGRIERQLEDMGLIAWDPDDVAFYVENGDKLVPHFWTA